MDHFKESFYEIVLSPKLAGIIALREYLLWILKHNSPDVHFESDAKAIIDAILHNQKN